MLVHIDQRVTPFFKLVLWLVLARESLNYSSLVHILILQILKIPTKYNNLQYNIMRFWKNLVRQCHILRPIKSLFFCLLVSSPHV